MKTGTKLLTITLVLLFATAGLQAENTFATKKLEWMSQFIPNVDFVNLKPGVHTQYSFHGHALKIRVNRWNEIEHIGYNLFDTLVTADNGLVYDFVERYMLDLDVADDPDKNLRMAIDHFQIATGTYKTIFTTRPTDLVSVTAIDLQRYQVSWTRHGKVILSYIFNMDYQLLAGSGIIELEQNYLRTVVRECQSIIPKALTMPEIADTCQDPDYVWEGGTFLIPAINNNRYFYRQDNHWEPICTTRKMKQSAYNILLSPYPLGNFTFDIDLDLYGYKTQSFSVPLSAWVAKTIEEGCTPYLGIKEAKDSVVKATIFCPNKMSGYCHVVSIELAASAIQNHGGTIKGRMYAYIPTHQVSPSYFK